MLYHCFKELKENYKTIMVSPSELESKLAPSPYLIADGKKRFLTLEVGHMCESIARAVVSNESNDMAYHLVDVTRQYLEKERMHFYDKSGKEDKQFIFLYDGLEQLIPLYSPYKNVYDLRNYRASVEIDFSGFKILLSGEIDWGIHGYHLFDNKTAKKKWDLGSKWSGGAFQSRFYSWMNMLASGKKQIDFTYLIQTKQKTFQLQEMTHTLTLDECEQFVYDKLYQYCLAIHNGTFSGESTILQRM